MKVLIFLMVLLSPYFIHAQKLKCVDTVEIAGFFYEMATNNVWTWQVSTGPLADDCYFVPEAALKSTRLKTVMETTFYERDTVKFVSGPAPAYLDPYNRASEACKAQIAKCILVKPFIVGQQAYKLKGWKYGLFLSYAKVRWLHLVVDTKTVADDGLDRPYTMDRTKIGPDILMDVYIPLELISLDRNVSIRRGTLVVVGKK